MGWSNVEMKWRKWQKGVKNSASLSLSPYLLHSVFFSFSLAESAQENEKDEKVEKRRQSERDMTERNKEIDEEAAIKYAERAKPMNEQNLITFVILKLNDFAIFNTK